MAYLIGIVGVINLFSYALNNTTNLANPEGLVEGKVPLELAALALTKSGFVSAHFKIGKFYFKVHHWKNMCVKGRV